MVRGGKTEEGSGWGTRVYLWLIHVDIWQNQYNIVKLKNKIKYKKKSKLKKKKIKKKKKKLWKSIQLQVQAIFPGSALSVINWYFDPDITIVYHFYPQS